MACNCVCEDGNLLSKCIGTCDKAAGIESQKQSGRDPLQGVMDIIYAQVAKMISSSITYTKVEFQKDQIEIYKEGFKEGIKFGMELEERY